MAKFYFILAVCGLLSSANSQVAPKVVLYDKINQAGNFIYVEHTNVGNLATRNFNDLTQSVCVVGTWLFYDKPNYNEGFNNAGMEWRFGPSPKLCSNLLTIGGSVSSLRYVGSSTDYRTDSITFFSQTYFQGKEYFYLESAKSLFPNGSVKSFIITGTSSWTVYDQTDYQGNAVCVSPQPSNNFKPEFVTNTIDFNIPHGTIKSVRKGCF